VDEQEIIDALEEAAVNPASAAVDGQSVSARSADDQIKLLDRAAVQRAAATNGGNGWNMIGRARAVPPGGT